MDYDELECILANLIFKVRWGGSNAARIHRSSHTTTLCAAFFLSHSQKLVKGYLSHKHRALVLSAKNPFPVVTAALK